MAFKMLWKRFKKIDKVEGEKPLRPMDIYNAYTARYKKNNGVLCPYCESDQILDVSGGLIRINDFEYHREFKCLKCLRGYELIYTMSKIDYHESLLKLHS